MGLEDDVRAIEAWAGRALPAYYRRFLLAHPQGFSGGLACLYEPEAVVERNTTYDTPTYCPGHFTLGDDSGGRAIVAAWDDERGRLFLVDHGDMTPGGFVPLTESFDAWLAAGCPIA